MNEIKIGFGPFSKPRINREAFDAVLKSEVVGENTATYEFETPVTAIGAHAFFDTNKGIEEDLFLHYIELPDSVETIHPETFDGICKLKSKLLVDNMLIIDNVLIKHFDSYNSGEVSVPEGMTAIAPGALSGFWAKKSSYHLPLKRSGKKRLEAAPISHLSNCRRVWRRLGTMPSLTPRLALPQSPTRSPASEWKHFPIAPNLKR